MELRENSVGNAVMSDDSESSGNSKGSFSMQNGREVFDNGSMKLWRCPVCAWWRNWSEERCCGCGLQRDNPAATPPKYRTAGDGS